MELEFEQWSIIYTDIENIANQYFNEKINQVYLKDIFIKFNIKKESAIYEKKFIAYSDRISENEYLVELSTGTLNELMNYAIKLSDNKKFIQLLNLPVGLSNENRNTIQFFLFFLYIDLIICHEWSHIFCGHVDFNKDSFKEKENNTPLYKAMEIEADSFAVTMILPRFASSFPNLKNALYNLDMTTEITSIRLWEVYIYSVLTLFDFLEISSTSIKGFHPNSTFRAFTTLMSIAGIISENPNLRRILPLISNDKKEIYNFFGKLATCFYIDYKKFEINNLLDTQKEAYAYCSKIGDIIKVDTLSDYRLIKR